MEEDDKMHNENNNKSCYKKRITGKMLLIICISIFVLIPYVLFYKNLIFPDDKREIKMYRDYPYIAVISVTNIPNKEAEFDVLKIMQARLDWIFNQKNNYNKHGKWQNYTFYLTQGDGLKVIFGYEEGLDIDIITEEITKVANLYFLDSKNNHILYENDIISATRNRQVETQTYDVIIEITQDGMQNFLSATEALDDLTDCLHISFNGSVRSDYYTIGKYSDNAVIIKGFNNGSAAQALVQLIRLKEVPNNLNVKLCVEQL